MNSDPVLREDFNADNAKLDAHNHDGRYNTKSEVTELLDSFPKFYVGTVNAPTVPSSTRPVSINTPFTAKVAIFITNLGEAKVYIKPSTTQSNGTSGTTCVWGTNTFKWYNSSGSSTSTTTSTYSYMLLG